MKQEIDEAEAWRLRNEERNEGIVFTGNKLTDDERLRNLSAVVGAKVTGIRLEEGRLVLNMHYEDDVLPSEVFNLEVDFASAGLTAA